MGRNLLRVVVLGAGFGGLELASILSERMGDRLDLTLIDKNDSFYFGSSKLDVMFGRRSAPSVKHSYSKIKKPGVQFRQEIITSIDPISRRVTTPVGIYEADVLVIALGADYNIGATPGLAEVALLLHKYLTLQGVRENCSISLVVPFELPIPPSYGTSKALLSSFREKSINYIPEIMVGSIDAGLKVAVLDDGTELPFDLFLGIPEHCVPRVLDQSGLIFDDWIPVEKNNLKTRFPNVYAIGDVTRTGTPKAGLFAAGAARIAAESIIAEYNGHEYSGAYDGAGSCYVEFGEGRVARADVDFFSKAHPTGTHKKASRAKSPSRADEMSAIL